MDIIGHGNFIAILIVIVLLTEVFLVPANNQSIIKNILTHTSIAIAVFLSPLLFSLLAAVIGITFISISILCLILGSAAAIMVLLCGAIIVIATLAVLPLVPFATMYELYKRKYDCKS